MSKDLIPRDAAHETPGRQHDCRTEIDPGQSAHRMVTDSEQGSACLCGILSELIGQSSAENDDRILQFSGNFHRLSEQWRQLNGEAVQALQRTVDTFGS